jgi:DNA-binding NtrC family response regulator
VTVYLCLCTWPTRRDASTCWCGGAFRSLQRALPAAPLLPTEQLARVATGYDGLTFQEAKVSAMKRFTREYFAPLLARCGGNISAVAREAGVERARLRYCLKAAGLR